MPQISLAIIARNNEATIGKLLESVKGVFDEIVVVDTGSTDKTKEVALSFGAKIFDFEWCDDFSKARQFSFEKSSHDWVCWLDTDDVVRHADKVKALVEKFGVEYDGISLPYEYCRDESGNVTTLQSRLRIVRKSSFVWKARVHEELIPIRMGKRAKTDDVVIVHEFGKRDDAEKLTRNLRLLKLQLQDEGEQQDPRTIYYIGNTFLGLECYPEALMAYYSYIKKSGWNEELFHAWIKISIIERHLGNYEMSLSAVSKAWQIYPRCPDVYLQLGWTFREMKEYEKSNEALEMISTLPAPKFITAWNPRDYDIHPLKLMGNNYMDLEDYSKALVQFKKVLKQAPKDEQIREIVRVIEIDIQERKKVSQWHKEWKKIQDQPEECRKLYELIPTKYRSYPSVIDIRNSFDIKTTSTGKDLVIYCGANNYGVWDPSSVSEGIGGSEEAVINIGKQLTKLGYSVTVYNAIEEEKEFDGVWYKPWWSFNRKDLWDYFIGWRYESIFDHEINAKKKFLWVHDIVNPNEYTPERLEKIDKVLVLSNIHRENLEKVPDEKIYLTTNGVDVSLFFQEGVPVRDKHKAIYTSSYDRGLEVLLNMWPRVKALVPDASLHVFYGWKNFALRYQDNPERLRWMKAMQEKMESLSDVFEKGRIGHKEMADEIQSSGVWAYPTTWLETNCISGLKAQIGGAIPVVRNYGALEDTVKFGVKVEGETETKEFQDEYISALVDVFQKQGEHEDQRRLMMETIRRDYSWEAIAMQWKNELLT